jgi:hypothetical protein
MYIICRSQSPRGLRLVDYTELILGCTWTEYGPLWERKTSKCFLNKFLSKCRTGPNNRRYSGHGEHYSTRSCVCLLFSHWNSVHWNGRNVWLMGWKKQEFRTEIWMGSGVMVLTSCHVSTFIWSEWEKTTNWAMNVVDLESSGLTLATRSVVPRRMREQAPLNTSTRALVYSEWTNGLEYYGLVVFVLEHAHIRLYCRFRMIWNRFYIWTPANVLPFYSEAERVLITVNWLTTPTYR